MYTLQEHGVELFRNIISRETLEPIKSYLIEQMDLAITDLKSRMASFASGNLIDDIDYLYKNSAKLNASTELLGLAAGLYPLEARLSKKLLGILQSPELVQKLKILFKTDNLKMHMPPAARFVLPNNTHGMVPPHFDASYNTQVDDFLVVWVPLTSITTGEHGSGGVVFFEKQITDFTAYEAGRTDDPYWLPEVDVDGLQKFCFELDPGDVLIFNKNIIHASLPNRSNSYRISIDYRFFPANMKSNKHSYDLSTNEIVKPFTEEALIGA